MIIQLYGIVFQSLHYVQCKVVLMLEKISEQMVVKEASSFLLNNNLANGTVPSYKGTAEMLYVHIPFCRTLCPFCSFNRELYKPERLKSYFSLLEKELDLYYNLGYDFNSVYIGGGTPTVDFDKLIELISYIKERFHITDISIESTVRELDENKINELHRMGINRLSLGIQTFDKELSKKIGRAWQEKEEAISTIQIANKKIDTLNVDLIFNLPFQSINIFENDLLLLIENKVKQITAYPLMPSIYSYLFKNIDRRREKSFYNVFMRIMDENRYNPSTPWCYSRSDGKMIDEYITKYDYYIGVGTSSISYIDEKFLLNTFSIERYAALLDKGLIPNIIVKEINKKDSEKFYFLNRLFALKISKSDFKKKYNEDIKVSLASLIYPLRLFGVIGEDKDFIYLKRKGFYLVGNAMRAFFSVLDALREEFRKKQI